MRPALALSRPARSPRIGQKASRRAGFRLRLGTAAFVTTRERRPETVLYAMGQATTGRRADRATGRGLSWGGMRSASSATAKAISRGHARTAQAAKSKSGAIPAGLQPGAAWATRTSATTCRRDVGVDVDLIAIKKILGAWARYRSNARRKRGQLVYRPLRRYLFWTGETLDTELNIQTAVEDKHLLRLIIIIAFEYVCFDRLSTSISLFADCSQGGGSARLIHLLFAILPARLASSNPNPTRRRSFPPVSTPAFCIRAA